MPVVLPQAKQGRWLPAADGVSRLARETLIYTIGGVLLRSASFVLTPVLTRALTQDAFGALDILFTLQAMATTLAGLNLDVAIARYFYEHDADDRMRFVSSLLWPLVALGLVAAMGLTAGAGVISQRLFRTTNYRIAVMVIGWTVPCVVVSTSGLSLVRFERRPAAFIALSGFGVLAQLGLVILAVRVYPADVTIVIIAIAVAQALVALVVVLHCRRYFQGGFSWPSLRRALTFSLPQFPSAIISWYLASANRFFLLSFSTLAAVASFAGAARINSVMLALIQAFSLAWLPFAMSIMHTSQARETYARVMYLVVGVLSIVTVALALTARVFLFYYAGPAYAPAAMTASILVLSSVVSPGFGWFLGLGLFIRERPLYVSIAQSLAFIVNTALNIWLIPTWGAEGAAVAVLGGSVAQIAAIAIVSNHFYPIKYNRLVWAGPVAASLVILLARWLGLT